MTTDTDVTTYRCLKTACHELCHVFGLTHCPYYECLMNGSNLLEEADRKPFMLCPICLRKIAVYLNFMDNIVTRYKQIHSNLVFMQNPSFDPEAHQIIKIIENLVANDLAGASQLS